MSINTSISIRYPFIVVIYDLQQDRNGKHNELMYSLYVPGLPAGWKPRSRRGDRIRGRSTESWWMFSPDEEFPIFAFLHFLFHSQNDAHQPHTGGDFHSKIHGWVTKNISKRNKVIIVNICSLAEKIQMHLEPLAGAQTNWLCRDAHSSHGPKSSHRGTPQEKPPRRINIPKVYVRQ